MKEKFLHFFHKMAKNWSKMRIWGEILGQEELICSPFPCFFFSKCLSIPPGGWGRGWKRPEYLPLKNDLKMCMIKHWKWIHFISLITLSMTPLVIPWTSFDQKIVKSMLRMMKNISIGWVRPSQSTFINYLIHQWFVQNLCSWPAIQVASTVTLTI